MPLSKRVITRIQDGDDAPTLGAGQDGYALTWDNATSAFVATDTATFVGAADTQVIFNDSGSAAGHANFTWDTTNNNKLTVNGQSVYVPGGDFTGTMIVGDGGGSLAYTSGNDGRYNTAIGIGAMNAAVSTSYSVAEGYQAGYSNVSGSYWIAQGTSAGLANETGNYWQAQGVNAGYSNVSGSYWIAQGASAAYANVSGSYWIAQGYQAGYSNVSGSYWIAQGAYAGYSNVSGANWIAQGAYAGYSNVSGSYWQAQGVNAGRLNETGSYWLAQGETAGYSNVSGNYWQAHGYNAGRLNETGSYWQAQGAYAGYSNVSGSYWLAQGDHAGYSNVSGSYWIAQGYQAGYSNVSGSYWIAQGAYAGYSNVSGANWIAQGAYAGYSNVSGSYWQAQGVNAGRLNETGSYWLAQGETAGYSNVSGNYWQAHGYKALYNALGNGDIGIGYQAGDNITTGEYNIVIGYDKDAPSATVDYQLVIGDYIEGNGTDLALRPRADATDAIQLQNAAGTTTVLQVDTTNDRVGIGGAPSARIHVTEEDAVTAAITDVAVWGHNSTGTPAAGFGGATLFELESSTTADTEAGRITYEWATATHASRKALAKWTVYDTAEREGLAIEASGTAPMIGFLGTAAVAQQAGTGETTGFTAGSGTAVNDDSTFTGNVGATAYRISDIVKALKNYGLLAQ